MRISLKWLLTVVQLTILVLAAVLVWKGLHYSPAVRPDVYPYLTSLDPVLVQQCIQKSQSVSTDWEDVLAILSTLEEKEARPLLDQLEKSAAFSDLDWGLVPRKMQKTIQRKRIILVQYSYYRPSEYTFPVAGTVWFSDTYGADREGGKRVHEGTDLFSSEGTPIVSVCDGKVEQLGWNRLGGERVGIRGDDGNYYYYAHLQSISPDLVKGDRVQAGAYLGSMGHTGDALITPDHLHFGIELPDGQWINPYPFLAVWQIWERAGE